MRKLSHIPCYGLLLLTVACGDDASTPARGDGGTQPAAGGRVGGAGGSEGGGPGSGGSPTSGGAGGQTVGQHCSPGTLLRDPVDTYGFQGKMSNCQDYPYGDGGVPEADFLPRAIELPQPMAAGAPYSISLEAVSPIPQVEFWGSDAECGFGHELLWAGDLERGVFCTELLPTASYTHIVMVWRGPGGTHGDVGLCPGAVCPP